MTALDPRALEAATSLMRKSWQSEAWISGPPADTMAAVISTYLATLPGSVGEDEATLTFANGEAYGLTMEQGRRAIATALQTDTIPSAIDGAIKGMRVLRTMLNSRGLGGADVAEAIIVDLERMNADPSTAPREPEMDLWPDDPAPIADKAVDHVFRELAKALGLERWTAEDGSETWEGDVYATMMRILYDAGVIDPETNKRSLAAVPAPPVQEPTWDALKAREAEIIRDYKFGNLTPLGVANYLRRAGFSLQYAVDRSNAIASPSPLPAQEDGPVRPLNPPTHKPVG